MNPLKQADGKVKRRKVHGNESDHETPVKQSLRPTDFILKKGEVGDDGKRRAIVYTKDHGYLNVYPDGSWNFISNTDGETLASFPYDNIVTMINPSPTPSE